MKLNDVILEAASPAQQAAIAISMKKAGKKPKQGVAEGMDGQVVFSGTGADGGKYEIIQSSPTDFMIHANGKHIDTYSSLQRAMSVLKNEVPGLTKGVAEGLPGSLSNSDYTPGATVKNPNTSCKRCHGHGTLWKAPNGTILPANDVPGAKRYKCGACDGIGMAKQGVAEEASPMIKPPANRFDNKQEAFDYAKEHGGKVFKSTYIDPNTGIKNIIFVVKKEQDMAEGSESDAYGNTGEKHECGSCDGTGIDTHDDVCPECGGKGWVRDKESSKKKGVAEGKADYNFDIEDLKRLEQIRDLSTLKAQALALISKPSAKPMKPEKVEWFKNALERMNSPLRVIKLMYDLLLSGEGKAVVGTKSSMNPNSYRQRFGEQGVAEDYNGEYDDEAGMAETNLITIARAAQGLLDTIDNQENLPEWVQEKIAKVEGMMVVAWDYLKSQEVQGIDPRITESICTEQEAHEIFDDFERVIAARGLNEDIYDNVTDEDIIRETAAWRRKEGKSKKGGLNAKGVASYRRENPGSKLQMAVTTKPSKLKKGSKAAKRRKSFCARMSGVKGPMKKPNGKPTRKALALRKWNC